MMKMIVHVLFYALCLITLFKSAYSVDNNNNNSSVFRATRSLDLSSQVESSDNFVRYFEIKNRLIIFPDSFINQSQQIVDFNEIAVDSSHKQVLVGARDYLIRLSYEKQSWNSSLVNIRLANPDLDIISTGPSEDTLVECLQSATSSLAKSNCRNYLKIILVDERDEKNDQVLVCGTNARRPLCQWRSRASPSQVVETFDGIGKSPHLPTLSTVYTKVTTGDIMFATSIDYNQPNEPSGLVKLDSLIDRSLGPSKKVRTDQYNSNWMNEPVFVGSVELGNYVYFFMRENAIEFMNCGQKVYSRVVRLCKYDQGYEIYDVWRSFEKARLNCSVNRNDVDSSNIYYTGQRSGPMSSHPFYFDEIQNIHFDKNKGLVYAIFSTSLNGGIKGSAVCVYDQKSLEAAFNGPFQYQKRKDSVWEAYKKQDSDEFFKCDPQSQQQPVNTKSKSPIDSQKFQLKYKSVQPLYGQPILVQPSKRLLHIVVDSVSTMSSQINANNHIDVAFISTDYNTILKYSIIQNEEHSTPLVCLLEELEVIDPSRKDNMLINKIKLLDQSALLIATSYSLIQMPLASCQLQNNYFGCLTQSDPYCVWDSKSQKCLLVSDAVAIKSSNNANSLHQNNINACRMTNLPVDGNFSEWSSWTSCLSASGDKCKCRMRLCNRPEPKNGGKNCDENASIEIAECQINGGWTQWSNWSSCQLNPSLAGNVCEINNPLSVVGVRTRTRSCTNPAPKNNGRICVGHEREEEQCTLESYSPCSASVSAQQNQWSAWGAWEECSRPCGEGFQMRRRVCNGKNCPGGNQEWRVCNSEPCKEKLSVVHSDWTLVELNKETGERLEKRSRFSSKYDSYFDSLETNSTIEYRLCGPEKSTKPENDDDAEDMCQIIVNIKDYDLLAWSDWSDWSQCVTTTIKSPCNGLQTRSRVCNTTSEKRCFGHDKESRECLLCSGEEWIKLGGGWSCWSDYGPCQSTNHTSHPDVRQSTCHGVKKRTRECINPRLGCDGDNQQVSVCVTESCFTDSNDVEFSNKMSASSLMGTTFTVVHLAVACFAAFLLGTITVLTLICLNLKSKSSPMSHLLCCCGCCSSESNNQKGGSSHHHHMSSRTNSGKLRKSYIYKEQLACEAIPTDQHSENTGSTTANSTGMDILNIQTSNDSSKANNYSGSSSSTGSAVSSSILASNNGGDVVANNTTKEYFTIANRFDASTGLTSSLLNDIIPDNEDDDDDLNDLNAALRHHFEHDGVMSATLKRLNKSSYLPNKSFNTYTLNNATTQASKELLKINGASSLNKSSALQSGNGILGNSGLNLSTKYLNNNNHNTTTGTLRSNKTSANTNGAGNGGGGGGSSSNQQSRTSYAFSMRTNLDQDV